MSASGLIRKLSGSNAPLHFCTVVTKPYLVRVLTWNEFREDGKGVAHPR